MMTVLTLDYDTEVEQTLANKDAAIKTALTALLEKLSEKGESDLVKSTRDLGGSFLPQRGPHEDKTPKDEAPALKKLPEDVKLGPIESTIEDIGLAFNQLQGLGRGNNGLPEISSLKDMRRYT
jgi:hypothetical protein